MYGLITINRQTGNEEPEEDNKGVNLPTNNKTHLTLQGLRRANLKIEENIMPTKNLF